MADRKLAKGDGQTGNISKPVITKRYIDLTHDICEHNLSRSDTGLLRVFSLVPKTHGKPSFEARVDDGSWGKRREIDLDIDIKGVSEAVQGDFRAGRNGYKGHRTERRLQADGRIFAVNIVIPEGVVFEGDVSFSPTFLFEIREEAQAKDSYDVQVINGKNIL